MDAQSCVVKLIPKERDVPYRACPCQAPVNRVSTAPVDDDGEKLTTAKQRKACINQQTPKINDSHPRDTHLHGQWGALGNLCVRARMVHNDNLRRPPPRATPPLPAPT